MLRTLQPKEPELIGLCHTQTWNEVLKRVQSHPREVLPSEAALRMEGTTALAAAVRNGAPIRIIQALLQSSMDVVAITHRNRGSVLHEALQHAASDDVLLYLLQAMIDHRKKSSTVSVPTITTRNNSNNGSLTVTGELKHVGVQERRILYCSDSLLAQDDLGRTALHLVVEKIKRHGTNHAHLEETWQFFQDLTLACPEAARVVDCDGNTPLVSILVAPRGPRSSTIENFIFRVAKLMLSVCPEAATRHRKSPRSWRIQAYPRPIHNLQPIVQSVDSKQTALYFALLNGRSLELVLLLIRQCRQLNDPVCASIVSPYHEVALHIAISTRAPLSIVYHVANSCPEAVIEEDVFGLSSLDWLWIRHVLDWHTSPLDVSSSRIISRRRFLPNSFLDWHNLASESLPIDDNVSLPVNPVAVRGLQEELLQRMKLLLPLAASVMATEPAIVQNEQWSLIHAACHVPCPLAMIRAALNMSGDTRVAIRTKDMRSGRLPLHYAAGRVGYSATIPVGISQKIHVMHEPSPVFDVVQYYPDACQELDAFGQLPLHIAIDTAKQYRSSNLFALDNMETEQQAILSELLSHHPGALHVRDGKSNLYPLQQAAQGSGASLTAIFFLLRRYPTVLQTHSS